MVSKLQDMIVLSWEGDLWYLMPLSTIFQLYETEKYCIVDNCRELVYLKLILRRPM